MYILPDPYLCMCMFIRIYVYMYVYVYTYIHTYCQNLCSESAGDGREERELVKPPHFA